MPTACRRAFESQSLHQGKNIPLTTSNCGGAETIYSKPNVTPITEIKNPKNNSNFRKPYLSMNKNVKVSITVIKTPPHNGILKKKKEKTNCNNCIFTKNSQNTYALLESKYKAIAVPITSCISDPMIAISIIIHNAKRGSFLYCL